MAALPKQVRIGWATFSVSQSVDECDAAESNAHFVEETRRIVLRKGLVVDKARECLLHEILHACFYASNLGLAGDAEEGIVKALTGPLLDALRSNPSLVTYLTSKE